MHKVQLFQLQSQPVSHDTHLSKKVLISKGKIPNITTFSQATFLPGQSSSAHSHPDMWETFFVQEGTGTIQIDEKQLLLEPGTCVTVAPKEVHAIHNTGSQELILLYFGVEN